MPTIATLSVRPASPTLEPEHTLVFIGRKHRLLSPEVLQRTPVDEDTWRAMVDSTDAGDAGSSTHTWSGGRKVVAGVLPEPCSRHNSPSRAWAIPGLAKTASGKTSATVVLAVDEAAHVAAACTAAARAFPLYEGRSGERGERQVLLMPLLADKDAIGSLQELVDGVRLAARLFDAPCAELDTLAFIAEARAVSQETGCAVTVIEGDALEEGGFGGLIGVGKAAVNGPALVVLDHSPANATRTVAWVGKGIVYDTGGLSIKGKTGMPGMKGDMGGAAAVLGAFSAAARSCEHTRVLAVLCLAENAVGPNATRPDDILTMHSGKTVEVNNTDAEGRLVLADGLSYITQAESLDWVADMATLTGAALVTSGKQHAAIYCNDPDLEDACVTSGLRAGEPVHPLLYAPELLRKEFRSPVADMKNSVKDRANAQCSCAGQFIANHLPDNAPPWVHVDIAGPAWNSDDRGTGFGVGLLLDMLNHVGA